jgi:hypothetical protein
MTPKSEKPDIKSIWGAQAVEPILITVEQVRAKANKFQSAVQRRNRIEYSAGVLVVAGFGSYLWIFRTPLMRLGSILIIAGAMFIMAWIHFRASAKAIPSHISFMDYVSRYREELRRQQSALRTVWLWYLGPLVPGLMLFTIGMSRLPEHAPGSTRPMWPLVVVIVAVFAGVWLLNLWGARRLQHQINELNRLLTRVS